MIDLTETEKRLIRIIQDDMPITERPYKAIADELGITEEEALNSVRKLKEKGIIRRIGASFDSRKLGYTSTLVSAKVPAEKIDETVAVINKYPGITHNYLRENVYNIWFTLIAPSKDAVEGILKRISEKTGVKDIRSLPAVKFFKVRVNFEME